MHKVSSLSTRFYYWSEPECNELNKFFKRGNFYNSLASIFFDTSLYSPGHPNAQENFYKFVLKLVKTYEHDCLLNRLHTIEFFAF